MLAKILNIYKRNPDYLLVSLGALLSAVGMALTSIAVYGELSKQGAAPIYYSIAFSLEIVPAILTSFLARKFFQGVNLAKALFLVEVVGGFSILVPLIGLSQGSLPLILFAVSVTSAVTGFMLPFHNTHMRRVLNDDEIGSISVVTTYTFAVVFIFGTLAGSILYSLVGTQTFFITDALTYFISSLLTQIAWKIRPKSFVKMSNKTGQEITFRFGNLSANQKKAFSLNLIMAVNCAPATALLPSLANKFDLKLSYGGFVLLPVLLFLILKTLGQLIGPFVIQRMNFDKLIFNRYVIPFCLLVFHLLYFVIFNSTNFSVVAGLVIFAHTASNVVFILSYYALPRFFNESEIGPASSVQHQLSIATMAVSSLAAGYFADIYGYNFVSALTFFVWVVYVGLQLTTKKETKVEVING